MAKYKNVDDIREEDLEQQMIDDINDNCSEEDVQNTFTDFTAEEMIDEEGSVENVSN